MSYYDKPLLLMLLGSPGSGKSYFARGLANELNAVRLNGDAMRASVFGSPEEVEKLYESGDRAVLNGYVFRGLDYATGQILSQGYDVVYDANNNRRLIRIGLEQLAEKHGALPLVVWIKTPYGVALQRGQTREDLLDQRRKNEENMRATIARVAAATDDPADDEKVITIDGQIPFDEQFISFQKQMKELYVQPK